MLDPPDTTVGWLRLGASGGAVVVLGLPEVLGFPEVVEVLRPGELAGTVLVVLLVPAPEETAFPGVEAEETPGSWCATTPVMTAVTAAASPATQRVARLERPRARSRRSVARWSGREFGIASFTFPPHSPV
jgi:hypothetical protein